MKKNLSVFLMIFATLLLGTGCLAPKCEVNIDSINSGQPVGKQYIISPGDKNIPLDNLQFLEYAKYTHRALQMKGFAPATSPETADIAVYLYYAVSAPTEHQYQYSEPVYGQTGFSTSRMRTPVDHRGGQPTYVETTTYSPTYGVVGYTERTGTYVLFTRFISLNAFDMVEYRKSHNQKQVWKTEISSSDPSGDLRKAFPLMLMAALPYLGENTGSQLTVKIDDNDPRLQAFWNQPVPVYGK